MAKNKSKNKTNTLYYGLNIFVLLTYILIFIFLLYDVNHTNKLNYDLSNFNQNMPFFFIMIFIISVPAIEYISLMVFSNLKKNSIKIIFKEKLAKISDTIAKILLLYIPIPFFLGIFLLSKTNENPSIFSYIICYMILLNASFSISLFFFLIQVSDEPGYEISKPYFYKTNELTYEKIKEDFIKELKTPITASGKFTRKSYTIDYYICEEQFNYIYAFIHLKTLSSSLANYYYNEGIFSFGEHLHEKKQMNINARTRIVYFFIVDKENITFEKLKNASSRYQRQFNMFHVLINLNKQELYISTLKSHSKNKQKEYKEVKNILDECLTSIIDERYGDLNAKDKEDI